MSLEMANSSLNNYSATILGYENGTSVMYNVTAWDYAGNSATIAVPEYPAAIILLPFFLATLAAVIIGRRRATQSRL
jgi:hypothetical protein